jgi:ribulose 1,5-bisphosphate carboxylase large subunit-like protein
MAGLVERFGQERVWKVGIAVLGHPPTWSVGMAGLQLVLDALEKGAQ